MTAPDLRVHLGRLTLPNPDLEAAGTFGYGVEFARAVPLERLGGLITKTLTRRPREGYPPPRLVETPAGMLNAVGLQNIGLDAFLQEKLPLLRRERVALIVSVLGDSAEDLGAMAEQLERADGVAALEVNLSCPNLKNSSGLRVESSTRNAQLSTVPKMVAQDAEATFTMLQAARRRTTKPLIAKLSPEVTDLAPIAQAAERAGADALSLVNTFVGMSLDVRTRRSRLGALTGGLSGPAIRPLAVYRVWYTAQTVRIPLIGLGGIVRAEDLLEFLLAGASAVAVGTATFADPRAAVRVLQGLERYCRRERLASLAELRGALRTS
jgi:dihydroorotate dehydrogenase (NAD+) catalytic subunit